MWNLSWGTLYLTENEIRLGHFIASMTVTYLDVLVVTQIKGKVILIHSGITTITPFWWKWEKWRRLLFRFQWVKMFKNVKVIGIKLVNKLFECWDGEEPSKIQGGRSPDTKFPFDIRRSRWLSTNILLSPFALIWSDLDLSSDNFKWNFYKIH